MEQPLPPANPLNHRLPLLDGLRGVAAVGVVLYHCGAGFGGFAACQRF